MQMYILDKDNHPVLTDDVKVFGECFKNNDKRRVGLDETNGYMISTIFLGLDHGYGSNGPILFETLIKDLSTGEQDVVQRYHTWNEAKRGHAKYVDLCNIDGYEINGGD